MSKRVWGGRWLAMFMLLSMSGELLAHDARPVAVGIREVLPGYYLHQLRIPTTVTPDNMPILVWPDDCKAAAESGAMVFCPQGLPGHVVQLSWPRFNPSLATWFSVATLDGRVLSTMQAPMEAFWLVPEAASRKDIARDYLLLGMEHIIGGLDHLLFVFALLVIARTPRRVLWTVTGFTVGHSLTLSLAALGVVMVPVLPMETAIALSIVFLAQEIARGDRNGLTYRHPLLVSCGFGLLHGLGFASALGEIGLVEDAMLWSLLFFNLGVEAGQLLFIAVLALLVPVFVRAGRSLQATAGPGFALQGLAVRADLLAAYCVGIPASWWLVERLAQFS